MNQISIFDIIETVPLIIEYHDIRGVLYRNTVQLKSYDHKDISEAIDKWKSEHRDEFFWGIRKP